VKITASGTTGASPFRFEVERPDSTSDVAIHNRLLFDNSSLRVFRDRAGVRQDKHMVFGTTAVLKQTQEGILPGSDYFPFAITGPGTDRRWNHALCSSWTASAS
jgi:hypothetical protein